MAWRRSERPRLIQARLAVPAVERRRMSEQIAGSLLDCLGSLRGRTVSFYWPLKGEPDLRSCLAAVTAADGRACLPVVVEKGAPLVFRAWQRGERLVRGVWNILVPAAGPEVRPDVIIAPVVGYDPDCYRLGHGGGYFDRTLAALSPRPQVIGVGYSHAAIPSIHPLPHDIPMDLIVTEHGVVLPTRSRPD